MILNLVRYSVLGEWLTESGTLPGPLEHIEPFVGISINLVRANFHSFGRRSVSRVKGHEEGDHSLDSQCAADFLVNYLFREFLNCLRYVAGGEGGPFREWLGLSPSIFKSNNLAKKIASFPSWNGYYAGSSSLEDLLKRTDQRLAVWRDFLNGNQDDIPKDVWETKATLEGPLHELGNLLSSVSSKQAPLPLFVVVDQYEVLPELNLTHGTQLQRVVNTLIKLRDPVVFYKIGARTYDWGKELRIWGAESRIEVQRDYAVIDLADLLMKGEESTWLFPAFATDVAHKRLLEAGYHLGKTHVKTLLGKWTPELEAALYFKNRLARPRAIGPVSPAVKKRILSLCRSKSPLEYRLAGAWALQRSKRHIEETAVTQELRSLPWVKKVWWRKERVGIALQQIASLANQKRRYFGWRDVLYLSGSNISAFLLIYSQIWDMAIKMDADPTRRRTLEPIIQTEGIFQASERWALRDRNESIGGRQRHSVLHRLGPAISDALVRDLAISNPGHSGFSLRGVDLVADMNGERVARFIYDAVSWAIFEERQHTSKEPHDVGRKKWYLHPILSPFFAIPHVRVKEPAYVSVQDVYEWFFGTGKIRFPKQLPDRGEKSSSPSTQLRLPLGTGQ